MMRKTTQDFIASLLVLSISLFYMMCTFRIRTTPIGNPHVPKVFPSILAGMGIVLSLFLLGRSVIQRRLNTYNQQDAQEQKALLEIKPLLLLALVASTIGVGYALLFELLGYLLSTTLFLMVYMFFLNGKKRWKINIIVPIVFSICVYIVFAMLLSVSLPLFPDF